MKQYTTPTVRIRLDGMEELLSEADTLVVTASDGETDIDLTPTVEGDILSVTLTEQQTAQLQVGKISFEVTLEWNNQILKSNTLKARLEEAVRDKELHDGGNS